jgi:hypothetical protein
MTAATATTAKDIAEHITEDVTEVSATATETTTAEAAATLFKGSMTILIVSRFFLWIG